jgi:hypothetical protein
MLGYSGSSTNTTRSSLFLVVVKFKGVIVGISEHLQFHMIPLKPENVT